MCTGGRKRAAKQAAQQAADNAQLAIDREATLEANRQEAIRIQTQADAANRATAAATAQGIENYRRQQMAILAARSSGGGSRRYGSNAASISQGILNQEQRERRKRIRRQGLKVSPADAYGEGNPGSTSASLKIGSQEASPGTGPNLPV